jgi:hypothetical protein
MWQRDLLPLIRVSFETSFDLKQLKLVSALSETKRLFRLFRFYTETEIFDVSIETKHTKDQPKQFDREHILVFLWKFRVVSKQICLFRLFRYRFETPKQTETSRKNRIFCFLFHETNRNITEIDLASLCYVSNRHFLFFCFEDTLPLIHLTRSVMPLTSTLAILQYL